ncbi:MAG: exopolyphosphatase, partial [Lachnospiraceae bacterium]|nr:exopolyphosphatase [Lachnospiraceae bacterium]
LVTQSLIFCRCLMEKLETEVLWIMDVSMCDGLCYDYAVRCKMIHTRHNFEEDIIATSRNIAKRYKCSNIHIKNMEELCLGIFDRLKKVHGMGDRERLLLRISAILHNCGKYISLTNVAECAYNIIMATDIIGLSLSEKQVIANVVKFNTAEFEYYDDLARVSNVTWEEYLVIAKLTAILRVANALDRSHKQKCHGAVFALKDDVLTISVNTSDDLTLEKVTLAEREEFFAEVFSVHPVIRQKKKM